MSHVCLCFHMSSDFLSEGGYCGFPNVECLYFVIFLQKDLYFVLASDSFDPFQIYFLASQGEFRVACILG